MHRDVKPESIADLRRRRLATGRAVAAAVTATAAYLSLSGSVMPRSSKYSSAFGLTANGTVLATRRVTCRVPVL